MQDKKSGERYFEKVTKDRYNSLKQKILSLTRYQNENVSRILLHALNKIGWGDEIES